MTQDLTHQVCTWWVNVLHQTSHLSQETIPAPQEAVGWVYLRWAKLTRSIWDPL